MTRSLEGKQYLLGDQFTVADGYAYYTLRNLRKLDAAAVDDSRILKDYFDRVAAPRGAPSLAGRRAVLSVGSLP